jgi:hypothetical protein
VLGRARRSKVADEFWVVGRGHFGAMAAARYSKMTHYIFLVLFCIHKKAFIDAELFSRRRGRRRWS